VAHCVRIATEVAPTTLLKPRHRLPLSSAGGSFAVVAVSPHGAAPARKMTSFK